MNRQKIIDKLAVLRDQAKQWQDSLTHTAADQDELIPNIVALDSEIDKLMAVQLSARK